MTNTSSQEKKIHKKLKDQIKHSQPRAKSAKRRRVGKKINTNKTEGPALQEKKRRHPIKE